MRVVKRVGGIGRQTEAVYNARGEGYIERAEVKAVCGEIVIGCGGEVVDQAQVFRIDFSCGVAADAFGFKYIGDTEGHRLLFSGRWAAENIPFKNRVSLSIDACISLILSVVLPYI